jgi:hypothetical protein
MGRSLANAGYFGGVFPLAAIVQRGDLFLDFEINALAGHRKSERVDGDRENPHDKQNATGGFELFCASRLCKTAQAGRRCFAQRRQAGFRFR